MNLVKFFKTRNSLLKLFLPLAKTYQQENFSHLNNFWQDSETLFWNWHESQLDLLDSVMIELSQSDTSTLEPALNMIDSSYYQSSIEIDWVFRRVYLLLVIAIVFQYYFLVNVHLSLIFYLFFSTVIGLLLGHLVLYRRKQKNLLFLKLVGRLLLNVLERKAQMITSDRVS